MIKYHQRVAKEITRDEFIRLYRSMRNIDLCRHLNVSLRTLMSYLRKHRVPLKGKGFNKLKIT